MRKTCPICLGNADAKRGPVNRDYLFWLDCSRCGQYRVTEDVLDYWSKTGPGSYLGQAGDHLRGLASSWVRGHTGWFRENEWDFLCTADLDLVTADPPTERVPETRAP